ncbi:MAG: hypothetical protein ACRYFS_06960 [Janthinobacterium lividum]
MNDEPVELEIQEENKKNELVPAEPVHDVAVSVARIDAAPTLTEKSRLLWEMPSDIRHQTLGELPAPVVAALIEGDPERNTALIANLPAAKYRQVINLGTPAQGRAWLERAVESGTLAGSILPSLMTGSDLADMLVTDPGVRRALPRLLNFERAERWRQLLTTNEWHKNIDELLMADTDELLNRVSIRNASVKAVLQSLLDYVPELYLEVINLARDRAARMDEHESELEDITTMPFGLPELLTPPVADGVGSRDAEAPVSPLADLIPEGGDPVFALATAGLSAARKAVLEEQLKTLLRDEIVATASFATADMQRAAGRVLFYLRAGLESFGPTLGDATLALETRQLNEISAIGTRLAESYRQKALSFAGMRDWLDARQKQILDAMRLPEAGIDPVTREPVLYLAARLKQDRADWVPTPLAEVQSRLADIGAWGPLARAAFGTVERMHTIYGSNRTRTWDEALRRTVLALVLYRRWEPELVRPTEDYAAFRRQYGTGRKNGIDEARQIVLDALDSTPDAAWKPSDAKARAREILLRAVGEIETMPLPGQETPRRRGGTH